MSDFYRFDAQQQRAHEDRISRHRELALDAMQELRRVTLFGGAPRAANLEPENRAVFLGQVGIHADAKDPQFRLKHPNEAAIKELVRLFRQDSVYAANWKEDAGESRLFAQMLQHMMSANIPTLYVPNQARGLFPVDSSIPPGAETVLTQRVVTIDDATLGQMSPSADDIQYVEIRGEFETLRLMSYARGVIWSLDELESAAFAGVQLRQEKMAALNDRVESIFDLVAFLGDAASGFSGMYNNAGITPTAVVTGTWSGATADQILGDVKALIEAVFAANDNVRPNVLIIPASLTRYLTVRRAETDKNVRTMIQEDYPGIRILECNRADLYDAAGTGPRIMAYFSNPLHLAVLVARSFTLEPPEKHGFTYRLAGRQKLGGGAFHVPLTAGYMDGC